MKKRLAFFVFMILLFSLIGCGMQTANSDEEMFGERKTEVPTTTEQAEAVDHVSEESGKAEKQKESTLANNPSESTTLSDVEPPKESEPVRTLSTSQSLIEQGIPLINLNETIVVPDVCEFYIDRTGIAKRIDPPAPAQYYTYYEAGDGKQLVDICVAFKNLKTTDIMADTAGTAYISFAGKYQYNVFSVIEEQNRGNLTYSNITSIAPLTTEYIHYMSNVPDQIVESNGEFIAVITIGGQKYHYILREGEVGDIIFPSDDATRETSGSIGLNQKVYVDGHCEFTPETVSTSRTVYPYNPNEYTLFFEAGAGKQFIDLCVKYKNMTTRAVRADNLMNATFQYDGNYTFNPATAIEQDNRTTLSYTNISYIEPLTPEYVHYFFEVPDEVANGGGSKCITLKVGNNTYTLNIN